MADKVARIRLMLSPGGFLGGLDQVTAKARATAAKMQSVMSASAAAGLTATKASLAGMGASLKGHLRMAAGLGGAFAVGSAIKGAVNLQHEYRNLAQQVNRVGDTGLRWQHIQKMIETAAIKTGQAPQDMARAFKLVYSATGDIEYTKASLEAMGVAATATGAKMETLAAGAQLAARKFGIGPKEAADAMARLIEKTDGGGAGLDDLTARFGMMAGEASAAGLRGKEGFSTLLGIMRALDNAIGEKASPGLKTMFQYLKDNTTYLNAMEKKSEIKFEPDSSAFDKIRKLLGTQKGRIAAEITFTGDARVAYDTLVKPFKDAYDTARKQSKSVEEATEEGYRAYDKAMGDMTKSTMKFSELQRQAADRMANDPMVILRQAFTTFQKEFTGPEMTEALKDFAQQIPKVAEGMRKLVSFTIKNPALAVGGYMAGKVALSFAGGALAKAGTAIGTSAAVQIRASAAAMGPWRVAGAALGIAAIAVLVGYLGTLGIDYLAADRSEEASSLAGARAAAEAATTSTTMSVATKQKTLATLEEKVATVDRQKKERRSGVVNTATAGAWSAVSDSYAGADDQLAKAKAAARYLRAELARPTGGASAPAEGAGGPPPPKVDEAKVGRAAADGIASRTVNVRVTNMPVVPGAGTAGGSHGLPPSPGNTPGWTPK